MEIYENIEQKSDEWFKIRKFCLTASNALTISVADKGLETLVLKVVADWFSNWTNEWYTNFQIERGNELEEFARELYELETWEKVKQVWFVKYSTYIWASPDWLVWDNGLIEIKCKDNHTHFDLLLNWISKIEKWYIAQMNMQMYVTWRQRCDFVSFNPNYDKSLIIHRINRDEDFIFKLKQWLIIWEQKIKDLINKYNLI